MPRETRTLEGMRQGMLTFISGLTAKHLLVGRDLTAATLTSAFELSHIGFLGGHDLIHFICKTTASQIRKQEATFKISSVSNIANFL